MKIDFISKQIVVSAKELKNASNPHTLEYEELLRLMRELPDFSLTVSRPRIISNANRGLTYEAMERYITHNAPEQLNDFWILRTSTSYPAVSKWFRRMFPEADTMVGFCTSLNLAA